MIINGRNIRLFDSMFDYVEDADFGHYETSDGKIRDVPYVEAVQPQDDSDFMIWIDDDLVYDGLVYVHVNFGEDSSEEESFLLESALDEEVFLIYDKRFNEKEDRASYAANAKCYRTEELARISGNLE